MTLYELVDDEYFFSLWEYLEIFDEFYLTLVGKFETGLLKYKKLVLGKMKKVVLEKGI